MKIPLLLVIVSVSSVLISIAITSIALELLGNRNRTRDIIHYVYYV